ncbi:MAG: sulfite exporter TauE/SafE family protein [Actinomycetota bacterium]|nr:sulfite exporter TauE/SafE family protein [Actinomycetota bacterium]
MALTTLEWIVLAAAVVAGSAIQGSIGFGLNVVVAPIAALIDPALVPAPLLLLGAVHVIALGWAERRDLRLKAVGWVLLGRLPGVVVAVWLLTSVSKSAIEILFGVVLLGVIALSLFRSGLEPTPVNLAGAGAVSGITGTTVAVGGPPIALVLAGGDNVRADITSVVVFGTGTSVAGLAFAGQIERTDMRTALFLLPALLGGFALSRLLVGRLDVTRTRHAVYAVAGTAALVLLVRGLT